MISHTKLEKLAVINDYLVSLIPDGYTSKKNLVSWLNESPYSPYISLYGGINSLAFEPASGFVSDVDKKTRYRLDDIFSFKFENFESFGDVIYAANKKLRDILSCNTLFRAYPEFGDIDVVINISNANNGLMSGVNHYTEARIEVYADSNESAMRVLLHELQHSIQVKEGFAIGESYYKEEGVMDLFVGSSVGVDGNYQYGSFSDVAIKKSMVELDDSGAMLKLDGFKHFKEGNQDIYISKEPTTLEDILKHDSLLTRYPDLKEIKVTMFINGRETNGLFNLENNEIAIEAKSIKEARTTLLHEIQHYIQHKEGWAKGGNTQQFRTEREHFFNVVMENDAVLQNIDKKLEPFPNVGTLSNTRSKQYEQLQQQKQSRLQELNIDYYSGDDFEKYRSLWGEQQSRATQYRANMDLEERLGEDWTKTLERVEGKYDEPIVRYDFAKIQQAIELEERYLDEYGKIDENLILAEGIDKLPRYFTSYEKFEKLFKNKISSNYAVLDTPIGEVKIHVRNAFNHFTNNTNHTNRIRYSGGFIPALCDPLFIVKEKYEGKDTVVFYKPMISKKKQEGLMHFAGFAMNDKGEFENSTYFNITKNKLKKYIKSKDEDLLYFKHAGQTSKVVMSESQEAISETRASDEILSENSLNVNGLHKEQRDKNFKAWFGDSKVKNLGNERENCLQFGESAVKESNCLESVSFGTEANVRSTSVGKVFEPLVVYHGTNQDFNEFRVSPTSWFTNSASHAEKYSSKEGAWWKKNSPNIMSVYLSIKNPYHLPSEFKNTTEREMILDMIKVDTIKLLGDEKLQILRSLIKESSVEKTKSSIIWNVSHKLKEAAQILGFDGYMASEVDSHMNASPSFYSTFSPFNPTQIKSIHNQGTFNSEKPNILEKNDYGMRHIEKVLSIVPDNIKIDVVKNYLAFNGIYEEHLQGTVYARVFDCETFYNPVKAAQKLDSNSSYLSSPGEIEAREVESLYIDRNKINEMSLAAIAGRFNREEHGELTTLLSPQLPQQSINR